MSQPKQNDAQGNMASAAHKQTRVQSDEEQKEQHAAASPAHVSPAMRLYRHALESIFALLELDDLSRVLAVSRSWAAAVRSMKSIHASVPHASVPRVAFESLRGWCGVRPLPPIVRIAGSPLLRHVAAIAFRHEHPSWVRFDNDSLRLLAQHAPNLTSLQCALMFTPDEPIVFPHNLTSFNLQLRDTEADTVGVLTSLAALPSLSRLHLELSAFGDENAVDLSILAACPSLFDLTINSYIGTCPEFTDAQVQQIRSSLGHLRRFAPHRDGACTKPDMLARLLQPPVTARWQDIGYVVADERTGELLLGLPTLTKIDLLYTADTPHVDFLPQLSRLTSFALNMDVCSWDPPDAVFNALVQCTSITELSLRGEFSSAQYDALFDKLTIKKLTISRNPIISRGLETLRCFATGPITQSLEDLTLSSLNLPPSDVPHLYNLRRLRTLHLDKCFSSRLDGATIDSLMPPTSLLPSLTKLVHLWRRPDADNDVVERQGPSFEWMQAR